jgi:hypothetical protein
LVKEIEKAITCLNIRVFANRNLKDVLSELIELIGEFKEEDKLEELIRQVNRENAYNTKKRGRALVKEIYYWPIIQ